MKSQKILNGTKNRTSLPQLHSEKQMRTQKRFNLTASLGYLILSNFATAQNNGDFLNSLTHTPSTGSPLEITGAANLGLAQGNADSLTYALQILGTYAEGNNEGYVGADLIYSENNGTATTNSFRLYGQWNRLLTDRLYAGGFGSYLTDNIADLNYRFDTGLTLGYHLIKNDQSTLSFEVGPGYSWEDQGGFSDNYLSLRFAQRFEHQLSANSKLWQSAIFTPEVDDFDNYLLVAEAGIDTLLSSQWSLRTSVRFQYDNTPAAGRGEDDLTLLTGLSYSLGGFPDPADPGRMTLKPDAAGPEAIQTGWSTTGSIGLALAKGNSDSIAVSAALDSAYRQERNETFLSAAYTFSENNGNTSADSVRASIQHNQLLTGKFFAGANIGYLRDEIADVSYRLTPAITAGYYLIKNDSMTLSLEAGPGFTFEEIGGISDDFFSIYAAQKFTWELNDRMTLNQSIVGTFDPSNSNNYFLVANAFLDTDITSNLAWRLAASYVYDNTPATGFQEDDTTLTTGITVKF